MEMNYPVRRNDLCFCGFSIANSGLFHRVLTSPGCILIDGRACSLLSWSRNMLRCLEFGPNQALSHTEWHKYLIEEPKQ